MGAYSRWALIRGWALIRINTVSVNVPPGHQGHRKKSESSILCLENFVAFINIKDRI